MARLTAADPFAASRALEQWSKAEEDALLESLRTQMDGPEPGPSLPSASLLDPTRTRLSRLKRPIALALVAVAAGALAFGILVGTSSSTRAFAQWSPITTSAPPAQLATAFAGCEASWSRSIHLFPPISSGSSGSLPPLLLTDSRGPFELLLYGGSGGEFVCLWNDGFIGGSGSTDGIGLLPPASNQAVGVPGVGFSSDRGAPYTYAIGRAGTGVTGVTLELADGTSVETTLQNGFYGAWWPTKTDVVSAQVSTANGISHQEFGDVGPNNIGPPSH